MLLSRNSTEEEEILCKTTPVSYRLTLPANLHSRLKLQPHATLYLIVPSPLWIKTCKCQNHLISYTHMGTLAH